MHFYPSERVALFIDGANTHTATRTLAIEVDYRRLRALFADRCVLVRAYYYTPIIEDEGVFRLRPLMDWLEYNGFTVKTRTGRDTGDPLNLHRLKSSLRMELALDAITLSPTLDHVVLFSGDGEFAPLVTRLKNQGRRVTVVSTIETQSPILSDDLRRAADQFIDLVDLEAKISRTDERSDRAVTTPRRKNLQHLGD